MDEKRIYSTGHSNGGGFTYLLWAARGDRFAAFAPSAAAAPRLMAQLKPKPVLHIAGENDPLVKFGWQKATMDALRQLNQCGEGQPWDKWCTLYPSKIGSARRDLHPSGHTPIPSLRSGGHREVLQGTGEAMSGRPGSEQGCSWGRGTRRSGGSS